MVSPRFSVSRSPSPRRSSSAENVRKSSISRSHSTSPSRSTSNTQDVPPDKNKTSSIQPITLRVENLTRNVNADHLREIFGKFGLVIRVEMTIPRGKASAMVIFASQQDADNAKDHMHDGWLDGNKLRVLLDTCQSETDQRVTNTTRRTVTKPSVSPKSRTRRGGRFRSLSPALARGRNRSPIRGGRGRRGPSPFRGRSRSFNANRRGGRSRSPVFRRRAPSPFRGGRRSPLSPFRGGRRRSPSPFRRRRSPSRSRSRSRSFSKSRSRSRTRRRSPSRSVSRSRSRSFSSRSRSSSRGRRRRSLSRSRSSHSRS